MSPLTRPHATNDVRIIVAGWIMFALLVACTILILTTRTADAGGHRHDRDCEHGTTTTTAPPTTTTVPPTTTTTAPPTTTTVPPPEPIPPLVIVRPAAPAVPVTAAPGFAG